MKNEIFSRISKAELSWEAFFQIFSVVGQLFDILISIIGHPDYNRLIKQADTALYSAKTKGRNKVVLESEYGGNYLNDAFS